jgi:hypothetical protein
MQVSKGHYGWTASSDINVEGDLIVRLTTMKRHNGKLVTTAQGCRKNGNVVGFIMFQDYNRTLISTDAKRVTARVVEEQHKLVDIDEVVGLVRAFYGLPVV